MSEEEIQELIQNAFQKNAKELKENPDNVFNYFELQKKYNRVLKDKLKLQQENQELKKQLSNSHQMKKQKEFTKWLEEEINMLPQPAAMLVKYNDGDHFVSITEIRRKEAVYIYNKYKEIIGGNNV
jgi:hypothetical protein